MSIDKKKRGREIQEQIRQVLLRDWDPIGVQEIPEAQDEYDSYVGGVYRLLVSSAQDEELVEHLYRIERETMGLGPRDKSGLLPVVQKLRTLNVAIDLSGKQPR
jgi:hypothetical protein